MELEVSKNSVSFIKRNEIKRFEKKFQVRKKKLLFLIFKSKITKFKV